MKVNLIELLEKIKTHKKTVLSISGILFLVFLYFFIFYKLPSPQSLKDFKATPLSTHILDRNGKLLYQLYSKQKRSPIKIDNLPKYVGEASISIEDKNFYQHNGISIFGGMLRAMKDTLFRQKLQGGSTITQQLVKSALLTPERTIQRKIKEIVLALWTERIFSKNQILELYLNQIPYGGAVYGVEEASQRFFGKQAKKLTLEESAFLAGLPQAPSQYSPYNNPDLAIKRRNEVLKAMLEQKFIDKNTYEKVIKTKINVKPFEEKIRAPHFVFYIKNILEQKYTTKEIEEGGLKITTTLDLDIQTEAEKILKEELEEVKELDVSNGAVLNQCQ